MQTRKNYLLLLIISCGLININQGQVTTPIEKKYEYSTLPILGLDCEELLKDSITYRFSTLDTLAKSDSKIARMGDFQIIVSTNFFHQTSTEADKTMIIHKVDHNTGQIIKMLTLSDDIGFSVVCLYVYNDFIYLLYYREINARDRDLFLTKIDAQLNLVWDIEIGKRFGNSEADAIKILKGNIYVLTHNFGIPILELFNSKGALIKRKEFNVSHGVRPMSFMLTEQKGICAVGSALIKEEDSEYNYNPGVVFKIDSNFVMTHISYFKSLAPGFPEDFNERTGDSGRGIMKAKDGHHYLVWLDSSNNYSKNGSYYFSTVLLIDEELNLKNNINIKSYGGSEIDLVLTDSDKLYLSSVERGYILVLRALSLDLKLLNNYRIKGFADYQKMEYSSGQFMVYGGKNPLWMAELKFD